MQVARRSDLYRIITSGSSGPTFGSAELQYGEFEIDVVSAELNGAASKAWNPVSWC